MSGEHVDHSGDQYPTYQSLTQDEAYLGAVVVLAAGTRHTPQDAQDEVLRIEQQAKKILDEEHLGTWSEFAYKSVGRIAALRQFGFFTKRR